METVAQILELYLRLTKKEQSDLLVRLNNLSYDTDIKPEIINKCSHCGGESFISNGSVNGKKRYKCKNCKRSFGLYSETIYNDIKKTDKFELFKNIMFTEGIIPLRTMCERVGISIQTSFDWRHKLMNPVCDVEKKFLGETQLDDIWVNYSQKGRRGLKYSKKRAGTKKAGDNNYQVKILTATNKEQTIMKVAKIGRISKIDIENNFGDLIDSNTKLISDAHPSIVGFAKDNGIKHTFFKSEEHVAKTGENVQFLNNQASRFDTLLNRTCKGVATKYLQNYANFFSFIENNKNKDTNKIATINLLKDCKGWDKFTTAEFRYKEFIENKSERTYRCPVERSWKSNFWNEKNFAS
jgi:transposase-like protein